MPSITLYSEPNQNGEHISFNRTDANLGNDDFPGLFTGDWDEHVSSFHIDSGTWRLYEDSGHHGAHTPDLGPGDYNVAQFTTQYLLIDHHVSSLLLL